MNDRPWRDSHIFNREGEGGYSPIRDHIPGWYYPSPPEPPPKTWRENIKDIFIIILVLIFWTNGFGLFSHIGNNVSEVIGLILFIYFSAYILIEICRAVFKLMFIYSSKGFFKYVFNDKYGLFPKTSLLSVLTAKGFQKQKIGVLFLLFIVLWFIVSYIIMHF